ncbi:MAG: ATP-dependent DNA helicase, partial [Sandaracinobacteroides sp.]
MNMAAPLPYPALVASHAGLWRADTRGELGALSRAEAVRRLADTPHLLLNAPALAHRLGLAEVSGLDLLELFAFVRPAQFLVPSAAGLAEALDLAAPAPGSAEAGFLQQAAAALLAEAADPKWPARAGAAESVERLYRRGWLWGELAGDALAPGARAPDLFAALPEWTDAPPRLPPLVRTHSEPQLLETLARLAGDRREPRPGQKAFTLAAAHAFQPRESADGPNFSVAEAGTGIGKTLGYLAPASLHASETGEQVWLSTYTRALQRQLKAETLRSLPGLVAAGKVVVRKGRENYLCL